MSSLADVDAHIASRRNEFLDSLFQFLAQPSISTQNQGMETCAELLRAMMTNAGIPTEYLPVEAGPPVLYGELGGHTGAPTVLFYGHYDVQPPEPLEAWVSPPFTPTIRDGRIYARGAGDNKGQLLAHVLAIQALRDMNSLPAVNIKLLFDGEEEIGSPNLPRTIALHRERLKADVVVIADGAMHENGATINLGCRGLVYVELEACGGNRDAHSGIYGGVVPNPVWQMVNLLASMRGADGRCAIDGFYDDVKPPSQRERELLARIPHDAQRFFDDWDIQALPPPDEWPYHERVMFQPTLNIAGFGAGYTGEGSKTVIPARARVKIDMRLVPEQRPDDIWVKFQRHVTKHAPGVSVRRLVSLTPSKTSVDLPIVQPIITAVQRTAGVDPLILPLTGGSSPRYLFTDILKLPTVAVPYASHDERNHAPNENLLLEGFFAGIRTSAAILTELAGSSHQSN